MEDGDGRFIDNQLWRQLYEAAFFELDPKLLPQKIADAQKAMGEVTGTTIQRRKP